MIAVVLSVVCALCIGYGSWVISDIACVMTVRGSLKRFTRRMLIMRQKEPVQFEDLPVIAHLKQKFGIQKSKREVRALRLACLSELPELIDVIALGLQAGVSFDAALSLYCKRYETMLAAKLEDCERSWQLGLTSRREALNALARELDVDAFTTFVSTVTESLEFGAPLAAVLVNQSQAVRDSQRLMVEERIEQAPIKMIVPTAALVLPALLLTIMGPLMASMVTVMS